jgi:hypothetical protein
LGQIPGTGLRLSFTQIMTLILVSLVTILYTRITRRNGRVPFSGRLKHVTFFRLRH